MARSFLFREFPDEVLVYERASGDTHLLDPASALLLQVLNEHPVSVTTLGQACARAMDIACDEAFVRNLEHLLAELEERELVERAR